MLISQLTFGDVLVSGTLIAVIGALCYQQGKRAGARTAPTVPPAAAASLGPTIVVNVPADWKPMEPLPNTETLSGARAQLWYTVFKTCMDNNCGSYAATSRADSAVEVCFVSES